MATGTHHKHVSTLLQRYYWFKRSSRYWTPTLPFPIEVEYSFRDVLESLRPKLEICESFETACHKVDELEQELRAKLGMSLVSAADNLIPVLWRKPTYLLRYTKIHIN